MAFPIMLDVVLSQTMISPLLELLNFPGHLDHDIVRTLLSAHYELRVSYSKPEAPKSRNQTTRNSEGFSELSRRLQDRTSPLLIAELSALNPKPYLKCEPNAPNTTGSFPSRAADMGSKYWDPCCACLMTTRKRRRPRFIRAST